MLERVRRLDKSTEHKQLFLDLISRYQNNKLDVRNDKQEAELQKLLTVLSPHELTSLSKWLQDRTANPHGFHTLRTESQAAVDDILQILFSKTMQGKSEPMQSKVDNTVADKTVADRTVADKTVADKTVVIEKTNLQSKTLETLPNKAESIVGSPQQKIPLTNESRPPEDSQGQSPKRLQEQAKQLSARQENPNKEENDLTKTNLVSPVNLLYMWALFLRKFFENCLTCGYMQITVY